MTYPLEKNLLRTFRGFLALRLFFSVTAFFVSETKTHTPLLTAIGLVVSAAILLYLSLDILRISLREVYLPIALFAITFDLILEQRLIQLTLAQMDLSFERNILQFMEPFTLPGIENATIPLLAILASTALLFVPLVLLSWQYRFRSVVVFTVGATILDFSLLVAFSPYARFDIPIEILGVLVRDTSFIIVGFIVTRIMTTQRQQQAELADVNRKLMAYATTREQLFITQERNRLARELHDTLAHTLSAVTVKLNAVQVIWESDDDRAKIMLSEVIDTLNVGNAETRRALRDLRASPLDDMGLLLAIQHLAETSAQRGDFSLDLQLPEHIRQFSTDLEQAIYRICQEALANIVEHANAKHVNLKLTYADALLELKIVDDGCGFNIDEVATDQHFGITGMQERAAMINGKLHLNSGINQGTTIVLQVKGDS
ncbi:MAG: hypothetical protein CL607_16300 [Anaerolineaceae bacterium]|nr:hypothetical protein [Anaerolineaceae bacterium]